MGWRRIPAPPGRRGDPAHRPHPRGRRCLLGDDHDPPIPQGTFGRGGAQAPRGGRRHAARRTARRRVRKRHRGRRRPAAADHRYVFGDALGRGGSRGVNASRSQSQMTAAGGVRVAACAAVAAVLLVVAGHPHAVEALGVLAAPDTLSTPHDRLATVSAPGVLANDVTLLGTTAILVSTTTHGTLQLASNGGYTYDPSAGYVGTDVFKYKDSGQLLGSATVTI